MAIDPLKGLPSSALDNRRADAASRGTAPGPAAAGAGRANSSDASDTLSLSDAAAALPAGDVPTGTLTPDQLRSIAARLASGEYNSADTTDRLATLFNNQPDLLNG